MSMKDDVIDLLAEAFGAAQVYRVPIDPMTADKFPAASVVIPRTQRRWKAHDYWFDVEMDVEITLMVAQSEGYDEKLDEWVASTLNALLTAPRFDAHVEDVPEIREERHYVAGGNCNIAAARLVFTAHFAEQYPVELADNRVDTVELTMGGEVAGADLADIVATLTELDTTAPTALGEIDDTGPDENPAITDTGA